MNETSHQLLFKELKRARDTFAGQRTRGGKRREDSLALVFGDGYLAGFDRAVEIMRLWLEEDKPQRKAS